MSQLFVAKVTSAHHTPEGTHQYVKDAKARACTVFIAAAHLAAQMLAISDVALQQRLLADWRAMAVIAKAPQAKLAKG